MEIRFKHPQESVQCLKASVARRSYLLALIHLISIPIEYPIDRLLIIKKKHKKAFHLTVSFIVVMGGGYMATLSPTLIPHAMWDSIAYAIHGLGLAPIAKHFFSFIKIEI